MADRTLPTFEQRSNAAFSDLQDFAAEMAASWINGNKSDVLDTLKDKPIVALLLGDELLGPNQCFEIALALHKRGWEG